MNKERRAKIADQIKRLEALNEQFSAIKSEAEEIAAELEQIRDEEQEAFDNLPEGLQQGERGQACENAINEIGSAIDTLGEFEGINLDGALGNLEEASA